MDHRKAVFLCKDLYIGHRYTQVRPSSQSLIDILYLVWEDMLNMGHLFAHQDRHK